MLTRDHVSSIANCISGDDVAAADDVVFNVYMRYSKVPFFFVNLL